LESRNGRAAKKEYRKISRFSRNLIIVAIVCLFISIACWESYYLFFNTTYFDISKIEISGNTIVDSEKIKTESGLMVNKNTFSINMNDVKKKILKLPRIEDVEILRIGLGTIKINVKERKPLALILINGIFYEIDNKNIIFTSHDSNIRIDLPLITGIDLKNFTMGVKINDRRILKVTRWLAPLSDGYLTRISEIHFDGPVMTLKLTTGEIVLPGDKDNYMRLYNLLLATLEKFQYQNVSISIIDMRFNNEIVVKPEKI